MSTVAWLIDATVMAALLGLAGGALLGRGLFRGIVLFIAFGLLLAVAWVRLSAPGVALAEVVIGAGLTGALLLVTASRLGARGAGERRRGDGDE